MNEEFTDFLRRNGACPDDIARLETLGIETLADAWDKASPEDIVWAVTRPGVMSAEQRRKFLVMVLESIEDKLTDPRSKNILDKLRAKEPITAADKDAAWAAAADMRAAALAVNAATWSVDAAAAWAAEAAAEASVNAATDTARDAAWADEAAVLAVDTATEAAMNATWAAAREKQAYWIRKNFRLADLHIN